ncbi:SET and MYND domain-containing protein 4-like [Periplaneta americana]|uniref:SET and MYND domain-containing protein 4-like n=1 Tax=Periplaneta americana TaxID=6978 RepID=UPI0037E99862
MEIFSVHELYQKLCTSLQEQYRIDNICELFAKLNNDFDRVEVGMELLKENGLLVPSNKFPRLNMKSTALAVDLRNSGNGAFQVKDDKRALMLYTESIATAPVPSLCTRTSTHEQIDAGQNESANDPAALSLAFANRSATLFSMGNYKECLKDIEEALKYNYPNKLLYKLFERQGKCYRILGRLNSAKTSLEEAINWLSSASALSSEKKQVTELELKNLMQKLENFNSEESNFLTDSKETQLPHCSYNPNSEIPSASDCVELKYVPEFGRYIAATRNLEPGDVLVVEKPFASVLLQEHFKTHCYNCLQPSVCLIPCFYCSTVMYCSEECRALSWKSNHSIDCLLLPVLQKLDIGKMGFLALRIVITVCNSQGVHSLIKSLEEGCKVERTKGFSSDGTYSSLDYNSIYWLVGNTERRGVTDLLRRSITAACILNCVTTMTNLFSKIKTTEVDDSNSSLRIVGGLLLRHLQNLPCNAHEVSELVKTEGPTMWESTEIGAAAYAVLSLINHSCDPNVVRHSYGDTAILRAIRPIAKGEQVLDNYGYHYALHGKLERKSQLRSQYFFDCNCVVCEEDWPLYEDLPCTNPQYLCNMCGCVLSEPVVDSVGHLITSCATCNQLHNITNLINAIEVSREKFQQNLDKVILGSECNVSELLSHLKLLDKCIHRPWKEYNDCQEAIKQCFAMSANCYK